MKMVTTAILLALSVVSVNASAKAKLSEKQREAIRNHTYQMQHGKLGLVDAPKAKN